jgi:hypothetical protein
MRGPTFFFDPTQRNTYALLMGGGFRRSLSRTSGKRMTMVQATDSDTTTAYNVRPFPGTAPEPPTRSDARPLLRDWGRAATEHSPARPRAPSVRRGAEVLSYAALSARSSCKRLSSSAGSSCHPVPARCVVRGYSPLPVLPGVPPPQLRKRRYAVFRHIFGVAELVQTRRPQMAEIPMCTT